MPFKSLVNSQCSIADNRAVRIDAAKAVSIPLTAGQEIASVSNRRAQRDLVSRHGANAPLPPLELGQELEALIVEELDDGRLLLKVGAILIEADSPGGLGAGQFVRLRVEQLQPRVVLHITSIEPSIEAEAARLVRSHLPPGTGSGELLSVLHDQLTILLDGSTGSAVAAEKLARLRESIGTVLAGSAPPSLDSLEVLARQGGLFYEAKLFDAVSHKEPLEEIANRDLKGLLLAALEESKARGFSTGLQHAVSAQLDSLETQQAVNLLAQLDGGAFQLQIPFFTGAGFSTATLAVQPDGHGEDAKPAAVKSGYSLLFMLDLENFGRTRINAVINDKAFRAVFFVDNQASLGLIREELPGFRETLLALGYSNIQLAAKPLRDLPPDQQEEFAALAAGGPSSIHLLDMKA
jgi:hypothetical protein